MTVDVAGSGHRPWHLRTGSTDNHGLIWTAAILLRIRRLGFESLEARPGHRSVGYLTADFLVVDRRRSGGVFTETAYGPAHTVGAAGHDARCDQAVQRR